MSATESGRRLCLLFEAGRTRFAVEATSVTEVATPDEDGLRLRGSLELLDLSVLLGGPPEVRPGMAVVLDTSPTMAVRIRQVIEVTDVSQDPYFLLPPMLGDRAGEAVRAGILHENRLYLELHADSVPHGTRPAKRTQKAPDLLEQVPGRGLVFESQSGLFGLPLERVSQVLPTSLAFSALPAAGGMVAGLFAHGQGLWPILSGPAILGGVAKPEALFVLAEVAGRKFGLCAERVLGVFDGFRPGAERGYFGTPKLEGPALFLDLERMFA